MSIRNYDAGAESRFRDAYSSNRPNIAVYDLIDSENVRARSIAAAVDATDLDLARTLSKNDAPIKVINELLKLSQIPIEISLGRGDQAFASKNGGASYSIARLSDGERNALLLAADVLTVNAGTLILVDERPDCAFVVSTHEIMLAVDNPTARVLLLREVSYDGSGISSWDADLVLPNAEIDDTVKYDILGARRKLLFIEGDDRSLDKPLYGLIFPGVSIIAKASCRDVENVVGGIRSAESLHWVQAFGIVDNDRRSQSNIETLKSRGVYALTVFSVESIYYHPEIQRRIAQRHVAVVGGDAAARVTDAENALIAAVTPHVQRLSERVAEKSVRQQNVNHLPGRDAIASGNTVNISVDVAREVTAVRTSLENSLTHRDVVEIVSQYPIRETSALTDISRTLGFQNRAQYEDAVRKLLIDDNEAREFVRSLFGSLVMDIGATS
ncbi:MAG: hypothetical protein WAM70_09110 [Pyrinomonadaceae bacterium]